MKISVIVVTLNAQDELGATIQSILDQDYKDLEIVVKDGGSTDGSVEKLPVDARIRLIREKDTGIYDAMNQALAAASGEYCLFLNCGDYLYDKEVLRDIAAHLNDTGCIVYGDIFDRIADSRVHSNPKLDEFALFRNVPCHQACFYNREMLLLHPFETRYRVRADYEQFLWCYYKAGAKTVYVDRVISSYKGGGFSETAENRRLSAKEHREITSVYMSAYDLRRYRMRMWLTLAPLRTAVSRTPLLGRLYNVIKAKIYDRQH